MSACVSLTSASRPHMCAYHVCAAEHQDQTVHLMCVFTCVLCMCLLAELAPLPYLDLHAIDFGKQVGQAMCA